MRVGLDSIVVGDYSLTRSFFVDALGFELADNSVTNGERPKRWVVRSAWTSWRASPSSG